MERKETKNVAIITRFLMQETAAFRGKNTCFPTSVVNAAIALGAIGLDEGAELHNELVGDLIAEPSLWNGSLLTITADTDRKIVEIIESHLPIMLGEKYPFPFILHSSTFKNMHDGLTQQTAHVVCARNTSHAFAVIKARYLGSQQALEYVDPLSPHTRRIGTKNVFYAKFNPILPQGWFFTAPVRLPKTG